MGEKEAGQVTYVLWMVFFFVYFKLLEKKPWHRAWRWLLSIVLGYVTAGALMFIFMTLLA